MVRNQACLVCKRPPPSDPDHLRSKGAGGGDEFKNLQPLCRKCHQERHLIGIKTFAQKYALPITFEFGYPRRTDVE